MRNVKVSGYQLLVYIAYGFYILFGLTWFLITLKSGQFNFTAFFIVAAFGSQVYYRHIFTNLIFGILCLVGSIFFLLARSDKATRNKSRERTVFSSLTAVRSHPQVEP